MNKPVKAGQLTDALYWSVRDGKSIDNIPGLIKQLLTDDMWKEVYVKEWDTVKKFDTFEELLTTPPPEGVGTKIETIKHLISNDNETLNLLDKAIKNPVGNPNDKNELGQFTPIVDNVNNWIERPTGNTKQAGLRRLRKDRPDLLEQVINNEKSINAAMVEAGFRKKTISVTLEIEKIASVLKEKLDKEEILKLIELLVT